MSRRKELLKDLLYSTAIMLCAFLLNQILLQLFHTRSMISVIFVLSVFLVSWVTQSFFWGIGAAIVSALMVNYSFSYPHFAELVTPEGLSSAAVMLIVSAATSTMTTKIKRQSRIKAEAERERMRGNLLRAVSHDLRTPLTAIDSACSAMIDHYDTLTDQQHRKLLQDIRSESQWLMRMVENLLSVTRLDGVSFQLNKQDTVVEELIDSLLVKFRKHYPRQPVEVFLPDEILVVPMDPTLIQQVLMNLLENAVFHAKGLQHLQLKIERDGSRAVFHVRDDGCGIPPEKLSGLFSGIFSTGVSADGSRSNMGIGLSACSAIIKAHGGEISARNRKNGGALFRFTLEIKENENGE